MNSFYFEYLEDYEFQSQCLHSFEYFNNSQKVRFTLNLGDFDFVQIKALKNKSQK